MEQELKSFFFFKLKLHLNPMLSQSEESVEHIPGMYTGKCEYTDFFSLHFMLFSFSSFNVSIKQS